MNIKALVKQAKPKSAIGAFQIQLQTCMGHYVIYINLFLMGTMWWHTTGAPLIRPYFPWADFWMFGCIMAFIISCLMLFDYKYIAPSRYSHQSRQGYKHVNPTVALIKGVASDVEKINNDLKVIKEKLGIE